MSSEFIEALKLIVKEKGINEDLIFSTVEDALVSAYKKNYGQTGIKSEEVRVTMNRVTGEIHVYSVRKVATDEEMEEDETNSLISLEDARKISKDYVIGDLIDEEVTPKNFGRVAAQSAKQLVVQRIKEAERNIIYEEFIQKEFDIITGKILRKDKGNVFVDLGRIETILGPTEQIPNEEYIFNDRLKFYIVEVKKTTKGPQIIVSRTHPGLIKRLFELEVPEIADGTVEVKNISREAGFRTKISVFSKDENVDPMGACVGPKGVRVQNIVNELKNEKIDIIKWDKLPERYIANSLSPAKVLDVDINEDNKSAKVIVDDTQLSLAIGKEGQNVRLAAKLTGWKIDIKSKSQAEGK